ncbi:MAG: hypothetical protein RBS86_04700 [Candidatus Moranbacteria bacterium]|nr:hypothetical protein [Candidatus Moranbacteria bacterium]
MNITKCDFCKKNIQKDSESLSIHVRSGNYDSYDVCPDCSQPFLKILEEKNSSKKHGKKSKK